MGHGAYTVHFVTMTSGSTLTGERDLGRSWAKVYMDPTGASSAVRLQVAQATAGSYRQLYHPPVNTSVASVNVFEIPSSVSGGMTEIPRGFRFIRIETTAVVANGLTFPLICSDD